jgi:hypothetical protein
MGYLDCYGGALDSRHKKEKSGYLVIMTYRSHNYEKISHNYEIFIFFLIITRVHNYEIFLS